MVTFRSWNTHARSAVLDGIRLVRRDREYYAEESICGTPELLSLTHMITPIKGSDQRAAIFVSV
jgi:hypothetical protein